MSANSELTRSTTIAIPQAPPLPPPRLTSGAVDLKRPEVSQLPAIDERTETELVVYHRCVADEPALRAAALALLDDEWRFSHQALLDRSCDELPASLLLRERASGALLGHAAVFAVVGRPSACYVGSVVVARSQRGRGFGRRLMDSVEAFCAQQLGRRRLHLETLDRHGFYARLGYAPAASAADLVTPVRFKAQHDFALRSADATASALSTTLCKGWFFKDLMISSSSS